MAKLKLQISVSLDGYLTGPNPSQEHPLGEGGEALHDWALKLAAWREPHGREGGDEPPFKVPVFVLTHHEREPLVKGETTFHFVTDGLDAALDRAREAASGKDVAIGGGGDVIQQCLAAGEVDEMWINVAPVLFGEGTRLFDNVGPEIKLEQVRVIEGPDAAHLKYRVTG